MSTNDVSYTSTALRGLVLGGIAGAGIDLLSQDEYLSELETLIYSPLAAAGYFTPGIKSTKERFIAGISSYAGFLAGRTASFIARNYI
ncbi:MAG: hypothetical protein HYX24_07635 [Candidatus Aenigmarchaeota archaeon]|nr:hypothetical protein [Candidatus Aenigmarchaeota archaeon]